ncbi:MAG: hypothetical protein KDI08_07225 [Pseudomonadales bacterium]|nr:hypothetical protein [Pseudomonadales bacterium]
MPDGTPIVHYRGAGGGAICGTRARARPGQVVTTASPLDVTCQRCRATHAWIRDHRERQEIIAHHTGPAATVYRPFDVVDGGGDAA